jgi:hypothetical protein
LLEGDRRVEPEAELLAGEALELAAQRLGQGREPEQRDPAAFGTAGALELDQRIGLGEGTRFLSAPVERYS